MRFCCLGPQLVVNVNSCGRPGMAKSTIDLAQSFTFNPSLGITTSVGFAAVVEIKVVSKVAHTG